LCVAATSDPEGDELFGTSSQLVIEASAGGLEAIRQTLAIGARGSGYSPLISPDFPSGGRLMGLAGKRIDKRVYPAGGLPPPSADNDRSIGSEFKIESAIAASAQPEVFNRLG
jgi:hypothetical protein